MWRGVGSPHAQFVEYFLLSAIADSESGHVWIQCLRGWTRSMGGLVVGGPSNKRGDAVGQQVAV